MDHGTVSRFNTNVFISILACHFFFERCNILFRTRKSRTSQVTTHRTLHTFSFICKKITSNVAIATFHTFVIKNEIGDNDVH